MHPSPRTELAGALDARYFGRDAENDGERAERVRRFAAAIGCSVQLARAVLGGRRGLTRDHLTALARRKVLDREQRGAIEHAEAARKAAAPRPRIGRPPSPKKAAASLRAVEALARTAGDPETAQRVAELRARVVPAGAL